MFITPAYAQSGAPGGDIVQLLLPLIVVFAIIYFMIIRPQQKRQREHRAMIEGLRRGDEIITQGGLLGKIVKVNEAHFELEIAKDTRVQIVKTMIVSLHKASNKKT